MNWQINKKCYLQMSIIHRVLKVSIYQHSVQSYPHILKFKYNELLVPIDQ